MESVGIRELKSKLSEYVRKASAGEIIQITDRGRVVAQLRAPWAGPEQVGSPRLFRAGLEGRIRLGGQAPPDLYEPRTPTSPPGSALKLLDELRGER
ncbi:MAG: type II toxin-antitoxin system prevent-host-death family antitoxin [Candidatus Eremiobacterota bacterium]